ncbi:ABC transporter permease, partial [Streptococcus danieliae]|nr:ABC transporter permease [Streptococcus danieliae]
FSLIFIIFSLLLLGFAIAYFLSPNMMAMITQLIMLGGLLFSPIIYPAERLPNWTEIIYDTLPFVPAANIVRTTLFEIGEYNISNYVVISIWGLLSLI